MIDMIKQVQRNLGTRDDGQPGRHTWSCFYLATTPKEKIKLPYTIKAFGNYLHITDPDLVVPLDPDSNLSNLPNAISGSFSWKGNPVSIMVSNGSVKRAASCHAWLNKPESVLWYTYDGKHGISQIMTADELPKNVKWAIGGSSLKDGDAEIEGFTGKYSDVFRKTSHMLIGFDQFGYFNAVEVGYMNKYDMVAHMKKLGIEEYILLDGGHITASNVDGHKRNIYTKQAYAIKLGG
jgi:hypothetical protein